MAQVTNYDTHVFEAGSFYSMPGATSAPTTISIYHGVCTVEPSGNVTLIVRDPGPSDTRSWARRKFNGSWTPWIVEGSEQFVNVTGDTMTGDLTITKSAPKFTLNKTLSNDRNVLAGQFNGVPRWEMQLGDASVESGENGSNFIVMRFSTAGVLVDIPFVINRVNGRGSFGNPLGIPAGFTDQSSNHIRISRSGTTLYHEFNNDGNTKFFWDSANCIFSLSTSGYQRLASGVLFQWGYASGGSDAFISYPTSFSSSVFGVQVTPLVTSMPSNNTVAYSVILANTSSFQIAPRYVNSGGAVGIASQPFWWFAVGN